jgi:hypothetical protein
MSPAAGRGRGGAHRGGGRNNGAAAAVRSDGVETRLRKERRGQRSDRARARGRGRQGKEKGGAEAMERPL